MACLCVKLIFRPGSHFSSMHIHDSKAMQERGIHCVMDQDREERGKKIKKIRNNPTTPNTQYSFNF